MAQNKIVKENKWDKIINDAITREDWFSGFTNAVTYFEHWGYWRLRWYCIQNEIYMKEVTKNLRVSNLIIILRLLKIIDQETYSKIKEIIKERNKLVHPEIAGISYRDRKRRDNAVRLLIDAKNCIVKLKEGIGKN